MNDQIDDVCSDFEVFYVLVFCSMPPPDRMCVPPGVHGIPCPPRAPSPCHPTMNFPGPRQPLPALVPMMHPFSPHPVPSPRSSTPQQAPGMPPPPGVLGGLVFSQEDLDMVLYGYARSKTNDQLPGHALSGLRLGDLSHGESPFTIYYGSKLP